MAINPAVYAKLPYDPVRDFVAVSELGSFPLILIVNASSPIKSVAELVAYAKANPDKTNYSSSSAAFQLATELFKQKTGAPMQEIPYKGANDSVMAVISGQVTATIADAGPVSGQVKGGQVRALAVAAPKRMADFPDVPTMKEAGADVDAVLWSGIFVPKATPPAIVRKLEGELMRIARLPDVIARLKPLGIEFGRQLLGRIRQNPGVRHCAVDRRRQGRQYQDGAMTPDRRSGDSQETMTVAMAATAILRISAPSPT